MWALWFTLRGAEGGLRGPVLCFGMGSGGGVRKGEVSRAWGGASGGKIPR